jgi:predicted ATPase/class 3 adenylate cyclase
MALTALRAGTPVAEYTVDEVLGRGGTGVVYRATHPGRAEPVALKLITADESWTAQARDRLQREARLAGAVVHRHILPVYDAGERDGHLFVAMRLERCDLAALLRKEGRLGPCRAAALVGQVASALDAAHAHGLVHRDVKPSNVLLGEDEEGRESAYLADFGVARAAFTDGHAATGDMVGTVGYAAPEQIRGEHLDARCDVYALGCLLYECLTGRVPFDRRDSLATLWAHLHEEPLAPGLLVPGLDSRLDSVVARALAKDARSRFGSAGALAAAALEGTASRRPAPIRVAERTELPTGTVTFLVTEVERSTRLLHELGAEGHADALAEQRAVVQEACAARRGVEVDAQGGASFFAFPHAAGALEAASEAQESLAVSPVRVRMGIHTGVPHVTSEGYVGVDVHRAARIAAAGHGGQVVVSFATEELVESDLLRSLGAHRLEDFDDPVTLFQIGDDDFPPLKTVANTNLPSPLTTFLGREAELHTADGLLRETRLLTITGPGGAGKTRLAVELARRAREERFSDYGEGVFACFLAPLREPELVLGSLAQALSVAEQPGATALETLTAHLGSRRMLLLVDNLEHLPTSAPALGELLDACPGLTLLTTSRERLGVAGETRYDLPALEEDESVALFCERSGSEPSGSIRELCARLEGLPLAIELAAARMSLLSPEELLARIGQRLDLLTGGRDADPRQQTLRATIEWSFDLLAADEQQLFARLSVFSGGCTLEAAEEVCDAELDGLESLLDKSLLRRSDGRFWMLETIREFAAGKLDEHGEPDELRAAHAAHFTSLADKAGPELDGAAAQGWIARLGTDHDNFRAALAHTCATDPERALRLVVVLYTFWYECGYLAEGSAWVERALGRTREPSALRAEALTAAASLRLEQGAVERARELSEEGVRVAREIGDRRLEARALGSLATALGTAGSMDDAVRMTRELVAVFDEVGDAYGSVLARSNLGFALRATGRLDEAAASLEDAMRLGRDLGNAGAIAHASRELAAVRIEQGDAASARPLLQESLKLVRDLPPGPVAVSSLQLAATACAQRDGALQSARLAGSAEAVARRMGMAIDDTEADLLERHLSEVRALVGEPAFASAFAEGAATSFEEALAFALDALDDA